MLKSLGLSADASYPEIYSQLNTLASDPSVLDDEFLTDSPFEFVLDYKTPDAAAEYAVLGWPSITAKYNSALPWYKQYGKYRLSGYFSGEYSYYLADDDEVEWERTSYNDGTWNESYTVYTATVTKKITGDDGQQTEQTETVVFNLTDNKDGTVTLAKAGSDPVTLSFEGKTLVN